MCPAFFSVIQRGSWRDSQRPLKCNSDRKAQAQFAWKVSVIDLLCCAECWMLCLHSQKWLNPVCVTWQANCLSLSLSLSPVVCVHYAGERKQKCKHTQKDQLVWIWVGRARWLINLLACLHSQFPLMWLNLFFVVVVSCLSWAVFWTDQSGNWFRFCVLVFSIFCRCCCRLTFDGFRFSVVVVVCMFYSLVKLLAGFVEVLL